MLPKYSNIEKQVYPKNQLPFPILIYSLEYRETSVSQKPTPIPLLIALLNRIVNPWQVPVRNIEQHSREMCYVLLWISMYMKNEASYRV